MLQPKYEELIMDLKRNYHTVTFRDFITLFETILQSNRVSFDTLPLERVLGIQGQNMLLRKLIKDLTESREVKYAGM